MEKICDGYGLIEGPVWDASRGLVFSEVIFGGVHCLKSDGSVELLLPHRKGIGGMALHENGGFVVSGRNISLKVPGQVGTEVLLPNDPDNGLLGFNDLTTDAAGRVYAGSLAFRPVGSDDTPKPGQLYCIDIDGRARVVGKDVMLTNGMGFSPDDRKLYHSESRRHIIRVYDVNDDGSLGPHSTFAPVEGGVPDGMQVAEDGSVWVAVAHGDRVDVFNPDGSLRQSIAVPLPMVTSVCFGGADLRDLYIVTGSGGTDSDRAGSIFRMRSDIPGRALTPARVRATGS
jgi:D-xylonolactonase